MLMRERGDARLRGACARCWATHRTLEPRLAKSPAVGLLRSPTTKPLSVRLRSTRHRRRGSALIRRKRYYDVVRRYIARCKGGSLAWHPFVVLQDQLRMEQVDAREKILRADLFSGAELPSIVEPAKSARALVARLGSTSRQLPEWLHVLANEQKGPGSDVPLPVYGASG